MLNLLCQQAPQDSRSLYEICKQGCQDPEGLAALKIRLLLAFNKRTQAAVEFLKEDHALHGSAGVRQWLPAVRKHNLDYSFLCLCFPPREEPPPPVRFAL